MKKYIIVLTLLSLFFTSCNKDEIIPDEIIPDELVGDNPKLLLSEYNYDDQYWKVKMKYNSSGQMVEKGLFENGDTTRLPYMRLNYFYNAEGSISKEEFYNIIVYGKADYFYNNNNLTKIIHRIGAEDVSYTTYEFNEDATFYSQESEYHCGGCDPPIVKTYNQLESFVTYNSDGFITRIERKNLDNELVDDFTFNYNNGNIIEIVDVLNSDKLEVNYDDSPNFNTYITGIQSILNESILGLPYLETFRTILSNMPLFFKFNNVNNPLEYKFNGEVIKTFRYEYNEYGYPVKINIGPSSSNEINLEYITNP